MNTKYPRVKYTVKYDPSVKLFHLYDNEGVKVGESTNGRELGRDAWQAGAEIVCYDYDLTLDESIPLISAYAKYKARN